MIAPVVSHLTRIKLKVAADMWFQQLGYDGEQVNTFQVFTYDLFNKEKHNSLQDAIELEGGSFEFSDNWMAYRPGTLTLKGTISPNDEYVSEVTANNTIIIRAERIKVSG
jgi:hypothetical protein